jgi:LPXTG-motif cell wall-anchored protein
MKSKFIKMLGLALACGLTMGLTCISASADEVAEVSYAWKDDYQHYRCEADGMVPEDHTYDENGYCTVCQMECEHTSTTYVGQENTATCESDGELIDKYTCDACGKSIETTVSTTFAFGHDWRIPIWFCTTNLETMERTYEVCYACYNEYDNYKWISVNADKEVEWEAGCEYYGRIKFTGYYNLDGKEFKTTDYINTDPTGHNWELSSVDWSDDYSTCNMNFTCLNDSRHTQTVAGEVTSNVTKEATCSEVGSVTYTATCTLDGKDYESSIDVEIPTLEHTKPESPVKENEVAATVKKEGSYDEVYYCTVCGAEISRETKTVAKLKPTATATPSVTPTTEPTAEPTVEPTSEPTTTEAPSATTALAATPNGETPKTGDEENVIIPIFALVASLGGLAFVLAKKRAK